MKEPTTFQAVIDAFPDRVALAKAIGVPAGVVRMWRYRDSIPAKYWYPVAEEAKRQKLNGYDQELFHRISSGKSSESEAA